jgi:hypothetical protein
MTVVPEEVRYVAGALGVLIVTASAASVIGTVITPRPTRGRFIRALDRLVDLVFRGMTHWCDDYLRRDRILAAQAPALLVFQLIAWLLLFFCGYSLILWPLLHTGITDAFSIGGSAIWSVGESSPRGSAERTVLDLAALTALVTITLQISYLPAIYSAFNRRATEVALLNARSGLPAWGPELLARTHFGVGTGTSMIGTLEQLYVDWERWSADVMETHTTYPALVRVRSPKPLSSWVTALLAVLDSAALMVTLCPSVAPTVSARLCLRSGFLCLQEIADIMGLLAPESAQPPTVTLTYDEFVAAVAHMEAVGFPVERRPEDAWPDFVGWRANYEQAAYAIAKEIQAPPALWSGPRSFRADPIPPFRPPL